MSKLSRDELKKISELSALKLNDAEIEKFSEEIGNILEHADMLSEALADQNVTITLNENILREDAAIISDNSKEILTQAPEHTNEYFVVPKIVDQG